MKLVVAIVNKNDEKNVLNGLNKNKLSATRLDAEGTFLKKKSNLFLLGVDDDKVDKVVETIKSCCSIKDETLPTPAPQTLDPGELIIPEAESIKTSGAIIFILELSKIIKT